ncbi:PEP/pyruvate-binding domain-containing protein [Campylobacter sp.]|uniref:PEP/pyruvate-binding domain-containing protein n=1 Tax=Campylobacter sp. TaxID=205 RepID=UPI0025BE7380|nr:PEP/pyruvate-binding domain-containing protein [Campylobacter sp.]
MNKLVFDTKARNLINLENILENAKILKAVVCSLNEISNDEKSVLDKISLLKSDKLIIRSSSKSEDSFKCSNAGAFLSLADISNKKDDLLNAIKKVGSSMPSNDDEILIQAMLKNIKKCGVAFSVDKDNFAPYFCLQYDENGSNSSITDGSAKSAKTYFHHRDDENIKDNDIKRVITLIKELENIFDCNFLDIEFAFDDNDDLYLLQVRPLIMQGKLNLFNALPKEALLRLQKRFSSLQELRPRVLGKKGIFGVMPDWNPAEIIGLRPRRLAFSLYKEIVADNIWAYQRDNYGYKDLRSHPLIHSFLGMPYVDVRLSFNSFIPKDLDEELAAKLLDYYLDKLDQNHNLHDKVEFDIVFSCYDFNLSHRLKGLLNYDFNENELKRIEFSLLNLTNNIINPKNGLYIKDIKKVEKLKQNYHQIINSNFSPIDKIYWLIEECKRYGTLPFAGVARAGFIAMTMLNSLVAIDFFTKEEKNEFLASLHTVSKTLSEDIQNLNENNKNEFLKKFGHLRAGTYNILSPRYDENFDFYFDMNKQSQKVVHNEFKLSDDKMKSLNILLREHGISIDANDFLIFLKTAIEGREFVKFEFSKLLSHTLSLIGELGHYYEIKKEDIAHLDIKNILNLYSTLYSKDPRKQFLSQIEENKKEYELTLALKLPALITDSEQFFGFFSFGTNPNFITQKSINAKIALENDKDLEGKIVLIYAADPGYDYLFSKNIAGFITCYGGANSHMAIRASELSMPAVIGVGEENFKKYLQADRLRIECQSEQIICL